MEFKMFRDLLAENFAKNLGSKPLFETEVDKDYLWNLYLDSFPEGTNPIYREKRVYDCSYCRQFIRNIGGTVYIDDNLEIHSIFEFDTQNPAYQPVADALAAYVKSKSITDIYLNDGSAVGVDKNRELLPDGTVKTWEHFRVELPSQCVVRLFDIPTKKGRFRDRRNVFKRSLDEISMEAIDTVLELISSNTLYKGEEWKGTLRTFRTYKEHYNTLPENKKDLYAWKEASTIGDVIGKIRNHSIGVLLVDISEGMDLDAAVRRYEQIVAPTNYKRPKAIFTKKMLEDAKKTISDLGYMDSLPRRYATLDDITVNNILFSNRDAAKRISGNVFDDMLTEIKTSAKQFSKVEEIPVEKFVADILPTAREVEVLLENKHAQNMVSLIAPVNKTAPTIFKWNNAFSWAYTGNITDSDIRERVKSAGGNVDGVLRFSIQWNDTGTYSPNDLDAHCEVRDVAGRLMDHIFFARMQGPRTRGFLDVDNRYPDKGVPAVENIAWPAKEYMIPGEYKFYVHQYCNRGGKDGFRAEIEINGEIHSFNYNQEVRQNQSIPVATVSIDKNGNFIIKEHLKSEQSSRDIWGLRTNLFVPVSVVMYSPNYWDEQQGIGHRHYFFMLKDCVNSEQPNGFYNEFLKHELEQHKRVFEALGSKLAVAAADDQLSGLGFSATKRNELIVKVRGATERVVRVKF